VGDGFRMGGLRQASCAGAQPVRHRLLAKTGLRAMMGDQFGLHLSNLRELRL
jgi:hypothetical protein